MRFIQSIHTAPMGPTWSNAEMLQVYEPLVERLPLPDETISELLDFLRFQLIGERSRQTCLPEFQNPGGFAERAAAAEAGVERGLLGLAEQIDRDGEPFDAVIGITSTAGIMPGISYRMAHHLGSGVRPDALMVDIAHAGCTAGFQALRLVSTLSESIRRVLLVSVETPTTLVSFDSLKRDVWQGNCTFGDGCVAVSLGHGEPSGLGLELELLETRQWSGEGLDLIRWGYGSYYQFALRDEKRFDADVREYVAGTLREREADWKSEPRWAIHPAGIALLVRLSRKLGIPGNAIAPSTAHYRRFSNMSSVSLLQIVGEVAADLEPGAAINLLSMGAGFSVCYGRVRRA